MTEVTSLTIRLRRRWWHPAAVVLLHVAHWLVTRGIYVEPVNGNGE